MYEAKDLSLHDKWYTPQLGLESCNRIAAKVLHRSRLPIRRIPIYTMFTRWITDWTKGLFQLTNNQNCCLQDNANMKTGKSLTVQIRKEWRCDFSAYCRKFTRISIYSLTHLTRNDLHPHHVQCVKSQNPAITSPFWLITLVPKKDGCSLYLRHNVPICFSLVIEFVKEVLYQKST